MARQFRRTLAWLPLLTCAAVVPTAWYVSSAIAEERKFVLLLADLPKDQPGVRQLANPADIKDIYFDKTKNGQLGSVRVDSFAEWWEEISYGDVTVSGDVYGWVQLPWRSTPPDNSRVLPTVSLDGSFDYTPFQGEPFNNGLQKFKWDFDGAAGPLDPVDVNGSGAVDLCGQPLWCPGERFKDLDGDRNYFPGLGREWGIDKNGNGIIDVALRAPGTGTEAYRHLLNATINPPLEALPEVAASPGPPPVPFQPALPAAPNGFVTWAEPFEWVDGNGDGLWDVTGTATSTTINFTTVTRTLNPRTQTIGQVPITVFRGDPGVADIWIDLNGVDSRPSTEPTARTATNRDEQTANGRLTLWGFIAAVFGPDTQGNLPTDLNVFFRDGRNPNGPLSAFSFPEPYEDFMRLWDGTEFARFEPLPGTPAETYVLNNWPGDPANPITPITHTGNAFYDGPDRWNNYNQTSSSKAQRVDPIIIAQDEQADQQALFSLQTPEPAWYQDWWAEEFGNQAPQWDPAIPYMRVFDPAIPTPPHGAEANPEEPSKFEPNRGGPYGDGRDFGHVRYANSNVLPDVRGVDGLFDGPAEYADLPSSIYHSGGDQQLGEVTGPQGNKIWGNDIGGEDGPNSPTADAMITAAGPAAFNIHGDGGWDAGNQLSIELLTWRTDGTSFTDQITPIPGGCIAIWHSDINLDGLIDMGERPGIRGAAGLFSTDTDRYVQNYSSDGRAGGGIGGPEEAYPYNRLRAMEDAVEALDNTVRWDNFLGGPAPFGNGVSGLLMLSDRTTRAQMFKLPAADVPRQDASGAPVVGGMEIRTRDRVEGPETLRSSYRPIHFFNGLGTSISSFGTEAGTPGEGDTVTQGLAGAFQLAFACHEYGHSWEGWPDLYDYDVYRGFDSVILNNPVSRWCVMSGGGTVHPVPILKADPRNGHNGWIKPVDITTALKPLATQSLTLKPWEFNRDKTVFVYSNTAFPTEQFWFWRTAGQAARPNGAQDLTFDRNLPANGMLIMHTDRSADPEGLPQQQRTGNRFVYAIVGADGLQQLENGENTGDPGDTWPGQSNATAWNRDTDPNNRWYNNQNSGLTIVGLREAGNNTIVDFRWTPQDVPSFSWKQPPGGTSVQGTYQLQYIAYDQFGGTQIQFFAYKNERNKPLPGAVESYEPNSSIQINPVATKFPGEIDGVYPVVLPNLLLLDGTYTFYAKLIPGIGADSRQENKASAPRPSINNRGNGPMVINDVDLAVSKLEAWTVRCTQATFGAERWEVIGSVTGRQNNLATTGQPYVSDVVTFNGAPHSHLQFLISSGSVPFQVGDEFNFLTTGFTPHSAAVLVKLLEVIEPLPPVPVARTDGPTVGLAPFQVVFRHDQSTDPGGAALTFQWDFGDGSALVVTDRLDQPVPHTYTVARETPYNATLTVSNSFGQSASQTVQVLVREAVPPTVRVAINPSSGPAPLSVEFTGSLSTDPNPGTLGLDYVWDFGDGSPIVTTANTSHIYNNAGNYRATLTVTSRPYGKSSRQTVEIRVIGVTGNLPPQAEFTASTSFGQSPLRVSFNATASSDPEGSALTYEWNFGDGSAIGRGPTIDHTFTKVGTFQVVLTVKDDRDQTDTRVAAIQVTSAATNGSPVARITVSGTQGPAPFSVNFDASRSADPEGGTLKYNWNFGDGASGDGVAVAHTYADPGRYVAVLTVADSLGLTGATTVEINVTSASGDSGQGQPDPSTVVPEVSGCGGGCGPAGFMPMLLTLVGIGSIRRYGKRMYR